MNKRFPAKNDKFAMAFARRGKNYLTISDSQWSNFFVMINSVAERVYVSGNFAA